MSKAKTFYRLGQAAYSAYLAIEEDGSRLTMTAVPDGQIATPEGLTEVFERIAGAQVKYPGDQIRFVTDPAKTINVEEVLNAQGGSGETKGQAEVQGEARDAGKGPKHPRRAIPPD